MTDASPNALRDEIVRLRSRIVELETELSGARPLTADPETPGERADRYRRLISDLPAAPWQCLPGDFRFTWVGPQAEQLLGFPVRDWYEPGFWALRIHPEDRDRTVKRRLEENRGRNHTFEYRMLAADGRVVDILDVVRTICADGKPILVSGLFVDVTEPKKEQEERRQVEQWASLGVLAGGIAHNFNNLLTSILGYSELVERDLPPGMSARAYLREVIGAANRAADLTRQILAYAGNGRFVRTSVNLSDLIQAMRPILLAAVAPQAELRLECPLEPTPIHADADQVRQVILNLVANASEALGDRPGSITIRSGARRRENPDSCNTASDLQAGPYVWLEVSDTGCGMNESTLARIFEPFFTTRFTGRGLGLAAVQGIVRAHGGLVQVTSTPGKGSSFSVLFPAPPAVPG